MLAKRELLSDSEIDQIRTAGSAVIIPLMWALSEVEHALKHECNGLGAGSYYSEVRSVDTLREFRQLALEMRGHCGQITNWLKNPVPFPYYSFLSVVMAACLCLISYGLVTLDFSPGLTLLIYAIILACFLGLRQVSDGATGWSAASRSPALVKAAFPLTLAGGRQDERPLRRG